MKGLWFAVARAPRLARRTFGLAVTRQLGTRVRRRLAKRRIAAVLLRSGLWDPAWYRAQPGVPGEPGLDPMRHFLLAGAAQGLQPNPLFDPSWYIRQVDGLAVEDALDHYLDTGIAGCLAPHPLFDPAWYSSRYPESARNPLAHFLEHGPAGCFDPHPLFDASWYQRTYEQARGRNPLLHYIEHGASRCLKPNPLFDAAWYVDRNPRAAESRTPLEHYVENAGLDPNPGFDASWYSRQPGVGGNPLADYIRRGAAAGLAPSPDFDPAFYQQTNPDAKAEGALEHYLRVGAAARRPASERERDRQGQTQATALGLDLTVNGLRVCVGVVTFDNPPAQLRRAIVSAQVAARQAGCALSVTLVDNGSAASEAVQNMLLRPALETRGNVGFGAAQNRLMDRAFEDGADVFIALNPDGVMHPGCLAAMLRMHMAARGCALIEALQFPDEHPKTYDRLDFETPWASGACLLIPRRIHAALGGFDDRFFMYCEDVDLSWRARAAGFQVKSCSPALLFHPTGGRVPDQETHRRFLNSGLALAVKWGDSAFAAMVREKMSSLGLAVPETNDRRLTAVPSGIADFAHMFSFAQVRW